MKSRELLLKEILNEMSIWCRTSTIRDWKTITKRYEHEGMSFLTISLPNFCSDFQKSLDIGEVVPAHFVGFAKRGKLPLFLGGFSERVFDRYSGRLLAEPDIDCILAIRQICLAFSKIHLPCTKVRERAAFKKFIKREKHIREVDSRIGDEFLVPFSRLSLLVFGNTFSTIDRMIYDGEIIPKHGPGSTAEKLTSNGKFNQSQWPVRLDSIFPFSENIQSSWSQCLDSPPDMLEPGQELPVRVISVPKTLKTPRIIAIEPTCMQYMQQGILEAMNLNVERDRLLAPFISSRFQEPNQLLAKEGSQFGNLATLDLSEASDSVSNQLVRRLLEFFPNFSSGVDACRSRKADVPGFGVIRLAKFASMGSALCFPFESMIFLIIIFIGIEKELNRQLTMKDLYNLHGKVRVYGDDIIIPVEFVRSVIAALETFGFQVNSDKSFWTGKFRESCGKEYYDGCDISVTKIRRDIPVTRRHVQEIISIVETRNQFYKTGMWLTARFLDDIVERIIPFPYVGWNSPALGRHSYLGTDTGTLCRFLHKPLVRAFVEKPVSPRDNLEGYGALLKFFLKRGDQPFADRRHLERAGRSQTVDIKLRWVSVH